MTILPEDQNILPLIE